jgi:acyl-coenzyme A thioesterase PaaI-like protein
MTTTIDQLNARGQGYLPGLLDPNGNLPAGAQSFTTIELKSNFLGTARQGVITCTATRVRSGRTIQV